MNICEYNLGSILKAAEELSQTERSGPSLDQIQDQTGLTTDQIVAALEFEPNPLGWHLEPEKETPTASAFVVRGQAYTRLLINRFAPVSGR